MPTAKPDQQVVLTVSSTASVTGSGEAIEIFEQATGALVGACAQGSQCTVAYAAKSGEHSFIAFITKPTRTMPSPRTAAATNVVTVRWIGVFLAAKNPVVAPGNPITVTATSTVQAASGYMLQIFDADSKARVTYCGQGNTCSVSIAQAKGGIHSLVGLLAKPSAMLPASGVEAASDRLTVTWLAVLMVASKTFEINSTAYLTATANADLTNTSWSLGIVDEQGHLVGPPCKTGASCTVQLPIGPGAIPTFSAVIGEVPPGANGVVDRLVRGITRQTALINIQARSSAVRPFHLLWGVDSCKAFTDDPNAQSGLYPQMVPLLGSPDFWGRYLTNTICPGLSSTEVAAAHRLKMGILPIYNDYNCSSVVGYGTAQQYAAAAVSAAHGLGIPAGRGLAIDIEPPSSDCPGAASLDTGFIWGWYDGITAAGYAPVYYGNATPGSVFATEWCNTVGPLPYVGQRSYLWSFEPSLLGGFAKFRAPSYSPNLTTCIGYVHAWQYQIGSSSATPDVDGDEATSELPLWYP